MGNKRINIEDLLADESFIRWAKHPDEVGDLYWTVWMENHPGRQSDIWLAKELINRIQFRHKEPSEETYSALLHRIMNEELNGKKPKVHKYKTKPYSAYWTKIAASFLLIAFSSAIATWYLFGPSVSKQESHQIDWIKKENPAGVKSQIQLPDGTIVWLNSNSSLTYPASFDSSIRNVSLVGEAFFDVAEDKHHPFTVNTKNLSTTALGTSFNVSSYPKEEMVSVSLVTGSVMVTESTESKRKVILSPGEQVIKKPGASNFEIVKFDYEITLGWKEGLLSFKEANINEIKSKLERWYGVQIEIHGKPDKDWRINGIFRSQSLERVLERLSYSKDFTFQISNKQVILYFTDHKSKNYEHKE